MSEPRTLEGKFAAAMGALVAKEVELEVDEIFQNMEKRVKRLEDLTMNLRILIADTMDKK